MDKFEPELIAYLDAQWDPTPTQGRLKRVLARPESNPGRKRVLAKVEASATKQLKQGGAKGAIDWSKVDWGKLFADIMALIDAILKRFGK